MMTKQLSPRVQLKQLRENLRDTQMNNRMDANALRRGLAKAKRIGAEMRQLKKLISVRRNP